MESKTLFTLLVSLYGLSTLVSGIGRTANSNFGRNFFLAIPFTTLSYSEEPTLYFASQLSGSVRVDSPANGMNKTISLNKGRTTELRLNVFTVTSNAVMHAGIYIEADTDITVSMFVDASYTSYNAEFFALPTQALSTRYTIPSGKPFAASYPSEIIIVGTQPSTIVSVTFPAHITGQRNTSFTLNRLDTYFYRVGADLSGAQVTSDYPVAVISATGAAVVPSSAGGYAEAIAEFVPPDNFAAYNFIIPALPGRRSYTVRVLPIEQTTVINLHNKSASTVATLHLGSKISEFIFGDEGVVINSSKPVFVYQYAMSSQNDMDGNGAFMRDIPAVENYVTESYFVVQGKRRNAQNIVQVILPAGETVEVDSMDINSMAGMTVAVTHFMADGRTYDVHSFNLTAGYHIIRGGSVPFGGLIHGHVPGDRFGYGHPLGLRKPERLTTTSSTTVTTPTTTPTRTTSYMTSSVAVSSTATSSASNTTTQSGNGPLCLSCDDVTHIYLCNVFERCSASQACFVEQYKNYAHQLRYRMGCKENSACAQRRRQEPVPDLDLTASHIDKRVSLCVECCHGNFCNIRGCGGEDLPPRYQRGPMCLSCSNVLNPAECNTLTFCQNEEVCYVEETSLFGTLRRYSYGCETKQCRASTSGKILCEQCCADDFCNHECNSTAPAISGIIG